MNHSIYLRFNQLKWLQEFRKGNIRFSCPLSYQDIENSAIGDKLEGVGVETITISSPDRPPELVKPIIQALRYNILSDELKVTETYFYRNAHKDRILCLYKLDLEGDRIINPVCIKNKGFDYDSFIVIDDIKQFFKHIKQHISKSGNYTFKMDSVIYSNNSLNRGPFDKPSHQSYQNEFRLLITDNSICDFNNGEYTPLDVSLGNMSDLTSDIFDIDSLFTAKTIKDFRLK